MRLASREVGGSMYWRSQYIATHKTDIHLYALDTDSGKNVRAAAATLIGNMGVAAADHAPAVAKLLTDDQRALAETVRG